MALAAVVVAMAVVAMEVGVVVTEVAMADAETSALMDTLRLICCGKLACVLHLFFLWVKSSAYLA